MPDDVTSPATELHWLTIAEAARLIEQRRLSPVEFTDALIARIEALDPQLNAFLLPTPDKAREQANKPDGDPRIDQPFIEIRAKCFEVETRARGDGGRKARPANGD